MDLNRVVSSDTIIFNPLKIKNIGLDKKFEDVLKQYPECKYIYLLGRNPDKKVFFLLDIGNRNDNAYFKENYNDASPELIQLFDTGSSFTEGPLRDDWGTWVSALIPLRNPESGQVVAVLGMDIDARSWNWKIASTAAIPVGALLFVVVIIFLYIINFRLKSEKARRQSEERFHELFDNASIGLYRTTPGGEILLANPALIAMLNFPSFEELAKRDLKNSGFESMGSRQHFLQLMEQDGEVKEFESVWIRNDGTQLIVKENAKAIRNSNGEVLYFEGTIEDITEKRKIEEALIASEKENKAMIEANPDLIFRVKRNGIITGYHAHKKELLFQPPENFLGKNISEVLPPNVAILAKEAIERAFQLKELVSFEYQLLVGDQLLDYEDRVIPISEDESYSFVRDVTLMKQKEQQLVEMNQQLAELVATKDKFFSIIAHDLKSPFNGILGFSHIIAQQIEEKDYTSIAFYAENIIKASERTLSLLSNLLEWARSQTGTVEYKPAKLNLSEEVNNTIELYSDNASQKSITIKNNLPDKVLVIADKAMIKTILRNLINNAIKYTNISGEVNIWSEQKGRESIISIKDNGIGISEKNIQKLFRIDGKHSTLGTMNEYGTGLGLILCNEFIRKHGGKIWVESKLGVGSSVYFSLPIAQQ